jgi:virginiamycin B lyase
VRKFLVRTSIIATLVLTLAIPTASAIPVGDSTVFDIPGAAGTWPLDGVTAGPDGAMWVTERTRKAIARFTLDGQYTEFPLTGSGTPAVIASGPDGNLWFTEAGPDAVSRLTPSGQYTRFPTPGTDDPWGITAGADGNLWFAHGTKVGRITTSGQIDEFDLTGSVSMLVAGADGNIWTRGSKIGRIQPDGTVDEFNAPAGVQLNGITRGPDGNVWLTGQSFSPTTGHLVKVEPNGSTTDIPLANDYNTIEQPTTGPDGAIWFSLNYSPIDRIGRYTMAGESSWFDATPGGDIRAIAVGADGNIWGGMLSSGAPHDGIVRIGTGTDDPSVAARPYVTGAHMVGQPETCNTQSGDAWLGVLPFQLVAGWRRDGSPIAGATTNTYTPTTEDAGHQLTCAVGVNYAFPGVAFGVTSDAVSIAPAPPAKRKTLITCTTKTKKRKKSTSCTRRQVVATTTFKKSKKVRVTSGTLTLKKTKLKVKVEIKGKRTRLLATANPKKGTWKLKVGRKTQSVKIR